MRRARSLVAEVPEGFPPNDGMSMKEVYITVVDYLDSGRVGRMSMCI